MTKTPREAEAAFELIEIVKGIEREAEHARVLDAKPFLGHHDSELDDLIGRAVGDGANCVATTANVVRFLAKWLSEGAVPNDLETETVIGSIRSALESCYDQSYSRRGRGVPV